MTTRVAHHLDLTLIEPANWTPEGNYIDVVPASPESIALMLKADETSMDGRSNWLWFRLPNGDLIFGCFPEGDTYFATEADHGQPS